MQVEEEHLCFGFAVESSVKSSLVSILLLDWNFLDFVLCFPFTFLARSSLSPRFPSGPLFMVT